MEHPAAIVGMISSSVEYSGVMVAGNTTHVEYGAIIIGTTPLGYVVTSGGPPVKNWQVDPTIATPRVDPGRTVVTNYDDTITAGISR